MSLPIRIGLPLATLLISSLGFAQAQEGVVRKKSPPIERVVAALGVNLQGSIQLSREQREVAHATGHRLVSLCPDCRLSTISEEGPCGWARTNREVIKAAVFKGMTEDQIVDAYVTSYGRNVLSVPKDSGLASMSWLLPYVIVIFGLAVTVFVGLRLAKRNREEEGEVQPDTPISADPNAVNALNAELDALD